MIRKRFSSLPKSKYKVFSTRDLGGKVFDRQSRVPGFRQEALASATVTLIGAGGLGGEMGEGLVRKGTGRIRILDSDVVEPSNLNRQLFSRKDIYRNKAVSLAKNLSRAGFGKTVLIGHPYTFEEAAALNLDLNSSAVVVGVDNDSCRVKASAYFLEKNVPVIFTGVADDGNSGYVFIQESKEGNPCFGCLYPSAVEEVKKGISKYPCPNTPAIKDILKIMGGIVIFAVDTLLMERTREWNYRTFFLDGSVPGGASTIKKKTDCLICGDGG